MQVMRKYLDSEANHEINEDDGWTDQGHEYIGQHVTRFDTKARSGPKANPPRLASLAAPASAESSLTCAHAVCMCVCLCLGSSVG